MRPKTTSRASHPRSSLRAALTLAAQDPLFAERFKAERRAFLLERRAYIRRRNARACAKTARARYAASAAGIAAAARAEARRTARRRLGELG